MDIRLATKDDIEHLIRMRWDFTFEHAPTTEASYEDFRKECKAFLERVLFEGK